MAKRTGFLIYGTVVARSSGRPLANLIIEALDKDLLFDDRLGSVITDRDGGFEIRYERADFQELFFDHKPDIYLRVRRGDGRIIYTTADRVRYEAGRTEAFHIRIPEHALDLGGNSMQNVIKLVLDLSDIRDDPELGEELVKRERPIKVAVVRWGKILAAKEIDTAEIKEFSRVPVTLEFEAEGDKPAGAYLTIGPNVADREFLAIETHRLWIAPRQFSDAVADLSGEKLRLPRYLFKRWLWLCRRFTITGRVVKRLDGCDEPVPGATVAAYDVDCWWFWWRRDLVASTVTNPDGTFEMAFTWCCLLPRFVRKPPYVINPDLLKHLTEVLYPHIGPIPPKVLKDPKVFEGFLTQRVTPDPIPGPTPSLLISRETRLRPAGLAASPTLPLPPPRRAAALDVPVTASVAASLSKPMAALVDKLRPRLPPWWPCWPFRPKDCTPDIVFKVTQVCDGDELILVDENPFQTRWNIPQTLDVTLLASEDACSVPVCEEPPAGDCLKFTKVNCVDVGNIGTAIGPPDLRGYAGPGSGDHPFAENIRMRGLFGTGSDVDYFKPEYAFDGGAFKDFPEPSLIAFSRKYWAPPPGSPPATPAQWNLVLFKPHAVDGIVVYKTLNKAEEENPLPAGWLWGYLWNDFDTLFYWNSRLLEGDGLYTIRLLGYRWDSAANALVDAHVMETCDIQLAQDEEQMVRIDNRLADDPSYALSTTRPCGAGTIHLCTYEPDCDFLLVEQVKNPGAASQEILPIDPCDVIKLADGDQIVIHFAASDQDGHFLGYSMHAHWGENAVFNVLTHGSLAPDPTALTGPSYGSTFSGPQGLYRAGLPAGDPEHDRPFWYGGSYKVTVPGSAFETCAYTLTLRVWKRTIVSCQDPYYVHVNWCSYSFTIEKV